MLKVDQNSTYIEVKDLLEDVFSYLCRSNNIHHEPTTINDEEHKSAGKIQTEQQPDKLMQRCKHLLNIFEREQHCLNGESESQYLEMATNLANNQSEYVDVSLPKTETIIPNDLYDECSTIVANNHCQLNQPNPIQSHHHAHDEFDIKLCPFSGLPATHLTLKKTPITGFLNRLEKRIFFNQTKRYFAGILDGWLLLYGGGQTDLKPTQCIQLSCDSESCSSSNAAVIATPTVTVTAATATANSDQLRKRGEHIFQLNTMEKKYHFQATSAANLDEWLQAINNEINKLNTGELQQQLNESPVIARLRTDTFITSTRKLPTPPPSSSPSKSDQRSSNRSEDIYEEPIEMIQTTKLMEQKPHFPEYDIPKSPPRSVLHDDIDRQVMMVKKSTNKKLVDSDSPQISAEQKPVKSWLFNRLNRSTITASSSTKSLSKSLNETAVKLSNTAMTTTTTSSSLTSTSPMLPSLPSTTITSKLLSIKGGKVNMIINQLEANGPLNFTKYAGMEKRNPLANQQADINFDDHNYEPVVICKQ